MDIQWLIYSPVIVALLCLLFYLMNRLIRPSLKLKDFIGFLVVGGVLGFGFSIIIIIIQTVAYQSPQGPLALIYYAPVGVAVGEVLGVLLWFYKMRSIRQQ
jgi:hypothetical protein